MGFGGMGPPGRGRNFADDFFGYGPPGGGMGMRGGYGGGMMGGRVLWPLHLFLLLLLLHYKVLSLHPIMLVHQELCPVFIFDPV